MDPLTNYIFEKIKYLDSVGREHTHQFFGVDRKAINTWKRTKKPPYEAAVAVFANDVVGSPDKVSEEYQQANRVPVNYPNPDPAPRNVAPGMPMRGEVLDPQGAGATQPGSFTRPAGAPQIVQPRMGGPERHSGIEVVTPAPVQGLDPAQVIAMVTQQVLTALGQTPAPAATGVVAMRPNIALPQSNLQLAPGHGVGWNNPRTPPRRE